MLIKRVAAIAASASMALATTAAIAPTAAAQSDTVTETTSVTYECQSTRSDGNPGNAPGTPQDVTVTYSETVAPGEFFTVTLEPGTMRNNNRDHARFTYDISLPNNAQMVSSSLLDGGQNLGGTPSLIRVNTETKNQQDDGNALRIWGGVSGRFGQNSGTSDTGGLSVGSNQDFRFPSVSMTFRAPATPAEEISVGLAGTGSNDTAAGTQLQYNGNNGGWFGGNDFRNTCAASTNAAQLTTTTVSDAEYAVLDSTTRIVGGDQLGDTSEPVTLRAQVSSPYAPAAGVSQGTVTFRDIDNDVVLGTGTPDADGFVEITHEFDRIPDDEPDVPLNVVAEYSGFQGETIEETIAPSSDSIVLTLTPREVVQWVTDFTARATIGELTEDSLPVTINATFNRPGIEYPEGTMVQLYRDGEAVGELVPMPETGTTLTWEDELPRAERNATHRYTVELETVRVEYDQWTGSTDQPAAVIVRGTDDTLPEEPGTGSLDMGSLTDPIEGSLSDSVGYEVAPLSGVMPELSASMSSGS